MVDVDLIKRKMILLENYKRELGKFPCVDFASFKKNVMMQKAVEKVLEEMIQICIDIGKHIISDEKLTMPSDNRGVFDVLYENKVLSDTVVELMKKMVGFRNVLVHMYEKINIETVYVIYRKRLFDFDRFTDEVRAYLKR